MNWSNYLFSFNGRVNRAKWWLFILICIGWVLVSMVISMVFMSISPGLAGIWGILSLLVWLVLLFAYFAVGAKRCHDRNKSAWWLLLFYVVPLVLSGYYMYSVMGSVFGMMTNPPTDQNAAAMSMLSTMQGLWWIQIINLIIGVWALVELGILKGTTGDNPYGPDPLAGIPH